MHRFSTCKSNYEIIVPDAATFLRAVSEQRKDEEVTIAICDAKKVAFVYPMQNKVCMFVRDVEESVFVGNTVDDVCECVKEVGVTPRCWRFCDV